MYNEDILSLQQQINVLKLQIAKLSMDISKGGPTKVEFNTLRSEVDEKIRNFFKQMLTLVPQSSNMIEAKINNVIDAKINTKINNLIGVIQNSSDNNPVVLKVVGLNDDGNTNVNNVTELQFGGTPGFTITETETGTAKVELGGMYTTISTPSTPDEFAVSHTLGKVPTGYIICSQNRSGNLYLGTSFWTSSVIYLQCDTSEVEFKIFIF